MRRNERERLARRAEYRQRRDGEELIEFTILPKGHRLTLEMAEALPAMTHVIALRSILEAVGMFESQPPDIARFLSKLYAAEDRDPEAAARLGKAMPPSWTAFTSQSLRQLGCGDDAPARIAGALGVAATLDDRLADVVERKCRSMVHRARKCLDEMSA